MPFLFYTSSGILSISHPPSPGTLMPCVRLQEKKKKVLMLLKSVAYKFMDEKHKIDNKKKSWKKTRDGVTSAGRRRRATQARGEKALHQNQIINFMDFPFPYCYCFYKNKPRTNFLITEQFFSFVLLAFHSHDKEKFNMVARTFENS